MISTDPPYYDNIGYSDLSDFFYVWLRRSLRTSTRNYFRRCSFRRQKNWLRIRTATAEGGAKDFFEDGFRESSHARGTALRQISRSPSATRSSSPNPMQRRGLHGLGDLARGHDPGGVGDHLDLAQWELSNRMIASGHERPRLVHRAIACGPAPDAPTRIGAGSLPR